MTKRFESLHAKVSPEAKAAIIEKARSAGKSVSAYLHDTALAGEQTRASQTIIAGKDASWAKSKLEIYNVDDIGSDPWYRNNGATAR